MSDILPHTVLLYQTLPGRPWMAEHVHGETPEARKTHLDELRSWALASGWYAVMVLQGKCLEQHGPVDTGTLPGEA